MSRGTKYTEFFTAEDNARLKELDKKAVETSFRKVAEFLNGNIKKTPFGFVLPLEAETFIRATITAGYTREVMSPAEIIEYGQLSDAYATAQSGSVDEAAKWQDEADTFLAEALGISKEEVTSRIESAITTLRG